MLPVKQILCPTDFSEPSLAALKVACELAQHFDAELHVINVIPFSPPFPTDMALIAAPGLYPSDQERQDNAQQQLDALLQNHIPQGVRADGEVKMGYTDKEIDCAVPEAQLIVMGTHGETGWRHLAFGSVTDKVVRRSRRPVLTVHGGPQPGEDEQNETALLEGMNP